MNMILSVPSSRSELLGDVAELARRVVDGLQLELARRSMTAELAAGLHQPDGRKALNSRSHPFASSEAMERSVPGRKVER